MDSSPAPKRKLRHAVYLLLPVTFVLATLEISARVFETWVPSREVDFEGGFTTDSRLFREMEDRPGMIETHPEKTTFLYQTFQRIKPAGTLRVFVVGESSVHQLNEELPDLAERLSTGPDGVRRPVEIVNCGGGSHGSGRLLFVVGEILEYQPDLVVLYLGNNEFEEVEQVRWVRPEVAPVARWGSSLAIVRVFRDRLSEAVERALVRWRNERLLARSVDTGARPEGDVDVPALMAAFEANVARMVALCRARGVPVVMGTVPSNLVHARVRGAGYPERFEERFREGRYDEARALARQALREAQARHQSSDLENGILRKIAREARVPLADVEQAVIEREPHGIPGETLFGDHCHLNAEGRQVWVRTFEPLMRAALLAR